MRKQTPACFEAETFHPFWKKDQETGNSRTSQKMSVEWIWAIFRLSQIKSPKRLSDTTVTMACKKDETVTLQSGNLSQICIIFCDAFGVFPWWWEFPQKKCEGLAFHFGIFLILGDLVLWRVQWLFFRYFCCCWERDLGVWDFPSQPTSWKEADSLKVVSFFKMFTLLGKNCVGAGRWWQDDVGKVFHPTQESAKLVTCVLHETQSGMSFNFNFQFESRLHCWNPSCQRRLTLTRYPLTFRCMFEEHSWLLFGDFCALRVSTGMSAPPSPCSSFYDVTRKPLEKARTDAC